MELMFNNNEEVLYLESFLNKKKTVLEWGSGGSSIFIAQRVKELHSIESDLFWFNEVKAKLPDNSFIYHVAKNSEEAPGHDGTLANYYNYVNYANSINKKFDVIFIDGRARVECAKVAVNLLKKDGVILMHDYAHPKEQYRRREYEVVEKFLQRTGGEFTLHSFKVKE